MFFYEQQIVKQIKNSFGLYFRYIDDIFITINWPPHHLLKQINRWNHFNNNINLSANIGSSASFFIYILKIEMVSCLSLFIRNLLMNHIIYHLIVSIHYI